MTGGDDYEVREIEQEIEAPFHLITAAYEADPKRVRASLLTEYRCRSRAACLLWHAWLSPRYGVCYYRPPYQLSPLRNERTTNPKARVERTMDGDRSWQGSGGPLDFFRNSGGEFKLACDHFDGRVTCDQLLADADAATPGKPTRRMLPEEPPSAV
jgi:hypothetical protein